MPRAQLVREGAAKDCQLLEDEPNWGDFVQNACLRLTIALFAIYLLFGCSAADDHAPVVMSNGTHTQAMPSASATPSSQPCDDGAVRDCKVVLPTQGGIANCFTGVQECVNGSWNDCHDP